MRQYVGSMATGVFNHTGGTNTINAGSGFLDVGVFASGNGTYNLSGTGALVANVHEYVGDVGTGVFNHTGGMNTISGAGHNLFLGGGPNNGTGTYTISGTGSTSTLSVANDVVVGNAGTGIGTLNVQNLGSVQIANNLTINSHGTVNLPPAVRSASMAFPTRFFSTAAEPSAGGYPIRFAPITTIFGATPTVSANKTLVIEGPPTLTAGKVSDHGRISR